MKQNLTDLLYKTLIKFYSEVKAYRNENKASNCFE